MPNYIPAIRGEILWLFSQQLIGDTVKVTIEGEVEAILAPII